MALHKENYGLIYNDDGSLCVTLRKDDVPFAGVKSFAVEEGTTNLHPNPEDLNAYHGYPNKWSYNGETYNGMKVFEWTVKDGTYQQNIGIDQSSVGNWVGKTVTFSVYYYVQNVPSWGIYISSDATIHKSIVIDLGDGWKRRIITATLNATTCDFWLSPNNSTTGLFKFCGFQIEEKPFATSFVDGTRPAGILKIPGVRDFTSKVVTAWFKINYVRIYPRIFDMSDGSIDATKGWTFYYDHVAGVFCFGVGSTVAKLTYSNPTNKWFYVVLIFNNGTYAVKLFDDSGLIWDYSFTATMPDLTNNIFKIGNVDSSGGYARPLNGLIAAPLIAEYKPSIWTAEYIQELYNMRRPFSVPPKMPII